MNAELLLEHFHRLGDAPDAVLQLRRFMLDLALEGVFLNGADREPWPVKPLGDLCEFKGGLWKGKKPPFASAKVLRVTNITKECEMNVVNAIELDVEVKQLATRTLQPGDILIEKSGGGENQPVGRVALFNETEGVYSFSNFTTVMRIVDRNLINPDYLHDFLRSFYFKGGTLPLQNNATNLRNLQLASYKQIEVPLPPLPEQHRIVAKVEELMALCDRLEAAQQQREAERTRLTAAAWQAVVKAEAPPEVSFALEQLSALTTRPTQVKALRQTILDLAVRGRLVEQDEGEKVPASIPEVLPEADEQPFEAPKNWRWTLFENVGDISGGFAFKSPDYSSSGVFVLRVTNIEPSGLINKHDPVFLPPVKVTKEVERFYLNEGDILLVMVGGSLGKIGVVTKEVLPALLNQNLWRIIPSNAVVDRRFLRLMVDFLVSFQRQITRSTHGHLSREAFRAMPVAIPPLAEQRRIVAKVEELMALCDGLEAALEAGEALRGKVLEAVVRSETGGTEPPAPVRVRQLPVPKVRAPRYDEAEVELAVAAEPVGHTGALQAVVRRGPGRPPKNGALTSTAARDIEAYLMAHPGRHGKAAILEATGVDAAAWNAAIKELLEAGKVERQGEKKGARYRAA